MVASARRRLGPGGMNPHRSGQPGRYGQCIRHAPVELPDTSPPVTRPRLSARFPRPTPSPLLGWTEAAARTQGIELLMTGSIRLRRATSEDAAAIARLLGQMSYPSTAREVRRRLETTLPHPDYSSWVAEVDGRVVGFAGAWVGHYFEKNGSYGRLLALVVDSGARGRGVGGALVREAERGVFGRGGAVLVVNSGNHRAEAHCFYQQQGYSATGVRFIKTLSAPARDA